MGMGNKLDPTKIEINDISKTHTCPLAKVMRKELRDRGIEHLKVVFSAEQPLELKEKISNGHRILPGSISFMSSCGGLIMASQVIKASDIATNGGIKVHIPNLAAFSAATSTSSANDRAVVIMNSMVVIKNNLKFLLFIFFSP